MKTFVKIIVAVSVMSCAEQYATAQKNSVQPAWAARLATPSVSGYEAALSDEIRKNLQDFAPKTDNLGNVSVTLGSGAPHRLIATPIDEPGYVVSGITADGFLRVQRLPQRPPNPVFDTLHFAQPVVIQTGSGQMVPGVFAGLSVHLQPLRQNAPKMAHPDELYVDIGARTPEEVRRAGVDILNAVVLLSPPQEVGSGSYAGPGIGDSYGAEVLIDVLNSLKTGKAPLKGSLTIAFVTQSWTGGRGLERILRETSPDELVYVGRIVHPGDAEATPDLLGDGVLIGVKSAEGAKSGFGAELQELAQRNALAIKVQPAVLPRIGGYAEATRLPERTVVAGVATRFPVTPAETLSHTDVEKLRAFLYAYASGKTASTGVGGGIGSVCGDCGPPLVGRLTNAYGTSGHEAAVREEIKKLLPEWARKKAATDAAGNLVLHLGGGKQREDARRLAFVAHMDEIGYEVKKIEDDGRLLVEVLGGGYTQYFQGHVVLVHKKDGSHVGGVLELPGGWDKPGFEWPSGVKAMDEPAHVYLATRTKQETERLGIAAGDFVTIPKDYRPLIGTRANARSFDDRVGCAALLAAVSALGPDLPGRDATFVWSTEEEVGLKGAAAFADQAAREGRAPDFVFAIDTFVSSDSPLESKRFGDAELGKGFVVRAVDNSNIVPPQYVERVLALAKANNIPAQYGVTGGGNDGAVFSRYGSVDVALGWPLRYSHSPAEIIDTKDLDALGKIVEVIARQW